MAISPVYPVILQNGTVADANQVMADFYQIQNDVNANAAHNGANSDITSLNGLTTPLPISEGGTGASTAPQALINLGVIAAIDAIITVPIGGVVMWTAATPPTNFLECNGQALSRVTFGNLFSVMGTTFGAGDGSTTFNIPDLRGFFVRGWANSSTEDAGRVFGSNQVNAVGPHTHPVIDPGHDHSVDFAAITFAGGGTPARNPGISGPTFSTNPAVTNLTIGTSSGSGTSTESRPDNVALMYVVRYQ
jgi:microcystin-dependent protein